MLTGATLTGAGFGMAAKPSKYVIPMTLLGAGLGATAGAIWNGGATSEGGIATNANKLSDPKAYIPLFAGASIAGGVMSALAVGENVSALRAVGMGLAAATLGGMVAAGITAGAGGED